LVKFIKFQLHNTWQNVLYNKKYDEMSKFNSDAWKFECLWRHIQHFIKPKLKFEVDLFFK